MTASASSQQAGGGLTTTTTTTATQIQPVAACVDYEGDRAVDGRPNGFGTSRYAGGSIYEGRWLFGLRHGKGVMWFSNGDVCQGTWDRDLLCGSGTYRYANGDVYEGEWQNDCRHGRGKITYASRHRRDDEAEGDISRTDRAAKDGAEDLASDAFSEEYDGEWQNDVMHGYGSYLFSSGSKYTGQWVDGKMNGEGVYSYVDGNRYEGSCKDNVKCGIGVLYYSDGGHYEGMWADDQPNGYGKYDAKSGASYEGQWVNGKADGIGTYRYPSGRTYVGSWVADQRSGHGTLKHLDGSHFVGEWASDKPHGPGVLTTAAGDIFECVWTNGKMGGSGVRKFPSGAVYRGSFAENQENGKGTVTTVDNILISGFWKSGKPEGTGSVTFPAVDSDNESRPAISVTVDWDKATSSGLISWSPDNSCPICHRPLPSTPLSDECSSAGASIPSFGDPTFREGQFISATPAPTDKKSRAAVESGCCKVTFDHFTGSLQRIAEEPSTPIPSPPASSASSGHGLSQPDMSSTSRGDPRHTGTLHRHPSDSEHPDGSASSVYSGETQLGVKNGRGSYTYHNGGRYVGQWVANKPHGTGTYTSPSGSVYEGEWREGRIHGKGLYCHPDGSIYEGDCINNKKHGRGRFVTPHGLIYDGDWKDDKPSGIGRYSSSSSALNVRHEGGWLDGLMEGQGVLHDAHGSIYEGEFRKGVREGHGKVTFADGSSYEGSWLADKGHGRGRFATAGLQIVYEGNWAEGEVDGEGELRNVAEGVTYKGQWKRNCAAGNGTLRFPDGAYYDGGWRNSTAHGFGKFVDPAGVVFDGEWNDGRLQGCGVLVHVGLYRGGVCIGEVPKPWDDPLRDQNVTYGRTAEPSGNSTVASTADSEGFYPPPAITSSNIWRPAMPVLPTQYRVLSKYVVEGKSSFDERKETEELAVDQRIETATDTTFNSESLIDTPIAKCQPQKESTTTTTTKATTTTTTTSSQPSPTLPFLISKQQFVSSTLEGSHTNYQSLPAALESVPPPLRKVVPPPPTQVPRPVSSLNYYHDFNSRPIYTSDQTLFSGRSLMHDRPQFPSAPPSINTKMTTTATSSHTADIHQPSSRIRYPYSELPARTSHWQIDSTTSSPQRHSTTEVPNNLSPIGSLPSPFFSGPLSQHRLSTTSIHHHQQPLIAHYSHPLQLPPLQTSSLTRPALFGSTASQFAQSPSLTTGSLHATTTTTTRLSGLSPTRIVDLDNPYPPTYIHGIGSWYDHNSRLPELQQQQQMTPPAASEYRVRHSTHMLSELPPRVRSESPLPNSRLTDTLLSSPIETIRHRPSIYNTQRVSSHNSYLNTQQHEFNPLLTTVTNTTTTTLPQIRHHFTTSYNNINPTASQPFAHLTAPHPSASIQTNRSYGSSQISPLCLSPSHFRSTSVTPSPRHYDVSSAHQHQSSSKVRTQSSPPIHTSRPTLPLLNRVTTSRVLSSPPGITIQKHHHLHQPYSSTTYSQHDMRYSHSNPPASPLVDKLRTSQNVVTTQQTTSTPIYISSTSGTAHPVRLSYDPYPTTNDVYTKTSTITKQQLPSIRSVPIKRNSTVIREHLEPQVVDVHVYEDKERLVPRPLELTTTLELELRKIRPRYWPVKYPIYVPRFIEVPVPDDLFHSEAQRAEAAKISALVDDLAAGGELNAELIEIAWRCLQSVQSMNPEPSSPPSELNWVLQRALGDGRLQICAASLHHLLQSPKPMTTPQQVPVTPDSRSYQNSSDLPSTSSNEVEAFDKKQPVSSADVTEPHSQVPNHKFGSSRGVRDMKQNNNFVCSSYSEVTGPVGVRSIAKHDRVMQQHPRNRQTDLMSSNSSEKQSTAAAFRQQQQKGDCSQAGNLGHVDRWMYVNEREPKTDNWGVGNIVERVVEGGNGPDQMVYPRERSSQSLERIKECVSSLVRPRGELKP